jgi:dolichyl-phosphate beta-glucosyltransferase
LAPELSIVIPMFREERRIAPTVRETAAYARLGGRSIELVLVDDGSDDRSAEVAMRAVEEFPPETFTAVTLKTHLRNSGKGAAVRTGLAASSGQWVLCMDADGSTSASQVERLFADKGEAALAAGSREMPESRVEAVAQRKVAGVVFRACLTAMGMNLLRDTQCGFKLYRRDAADLVVRHGREDGYTFDLEHLLIIRRAGLRVTEVGVRWTHRDGGQVRPVRDGLKMLGAAARLRARFKPGVIRVPSGGASPVGN